MKNPVKRPGRVSKRDQLLDAAADIVSKRGAQYLTIDAVALAANVTKAGLIYHFKTRDELLSALVERMVAQLDILAYARNALPTTPSSLRTTLDRIKQYTFDMPPDQRQLLSNMLGAVSSNPLLLPPAQALYARGYNWMIQSGEHAGEAMMLSAALDGITLLELLNLHQFTPEQRDAMRAAIDAAISKLP